MIDIQRIIEKDDVSVNNISYILSSVGFNVDTLNNNEIWIKNENYLPLQIVIDERGDKLLKFESSYGLKNSSPLLDKYNIADELNRALLIRFYVSDGKGVLIGDYYLSCEDGILTNQLIHTCQLFQQIFIGVLREKFVEGGVLDV